ncbi:unnamed protein product [Vicia faba]|uniref:Uncharacterized protein n=1 Tax=Vicia faba TaxID=3906 RepID=A0AAV1A884_VICFA|nr:unnamed protein product [Vicia faba]
MEESKMLVKSDLESFDIHLSHSSPSADSTNKSFVSFKKEGCKSPLSSWGSRRESEKCFSLSGELDYLGMIQNRSFDDGLLWEMDKTSYDEKVMNLHVTHLEEEIIKLKDQVENSENQVDDLWGELKWKEEELHNLKEFSEIEIYKLKAQIEENENTILRKELENKSCENHELHGQLIEAKENMAESDLELVSGRKHIEILENLVIIYEQEVQKLESKMLDSRDNFSLEKDELHFAIASLLKTKIELTSTLANCVFRNKELENKLRQYEAEKLKQEELQVTQQVVLQDENNYLWEELGKRTEDIEAVTKELYMVMIERDEANVKIDRLEAEICTLICEI